MNHSIPLTTAQQVGLVLLRTLVGWHFLYEGYFKLWRPAWSRTGAPLAAFSAAGYLKAGTGPLAPFFRRFAEPPYIGAIDVMVAVGLVAVGLSLILGLFTRLGALGALALLMLFYLAAIPTAGLPQPGAEGAYLFVNKTLIEAAAVFVLLAFGTGRIAGLDLLLAGRRAAPASSPAPAAAVGAAS
jgi:thiosulfate dehydrogenase (quinone) large subunit